MNEMGPILIYLFCCCEYTRVVSLISDILWSINILWENNKVIGVYEDYGILILDKNMVG